MSKQYNSFKQKLTHIKSGGGHFDISVIVPVYNTARYLSECIESILAQTKKNLQIILVNDGSTDDSAKICKKYAKRYRNIAYVYKENTGVAATRNLGASLACGDYIAFVDSDDMIDPFMYERLYNLAQHYNCEVATCGATHFNNRTPRKYPSPLFDNAFRNSKIKCGSLVNIPQQIFNTSCWNKLILRSYFEENDIKFPEGMVYEDLPFAIELLAKAKNIALTPEKLYLYRSRTEDESSITQQRHDIANLQDRLKASRMVLKLLESYMPSNIAKLYQHRAIDHDLKLAFRSIPDTLKEYQLHALEEIVSFVSDCIDKDVLQESSTLDRLKIALANDGDIASLLKVINYEENAHRKSPIHKESGKFFTHVPKIFDERILNTLNSDKLDVTRRVLWKEPLAQIEHFDIDDGKLIIFGHVYNRYVSVARDQRTYKAFLTDEFDNEFANLEVETVEPRRILQSHKVMRNLYDQSIIDYSGCGFKVTLPFDVLTQASSEDASKEFLIRIEYKDPIEDGTFYLGKPSSPVEVLAKLMPGMSVVQGGWLRLNADLVKAKDVELLPQEKGKNIGKTDIPAVSVIVPIHGKDDDLVAALDSIAAQTLSNIEVLLVDDQTSWDGGNLARLYAVKYENFIYLQKQSGTLGDACNYGVSKAKGEFIAFASPYDIMSQNAYEDLYEAAKKNNVSVAAGDIVYYYDDGSVKQCNLARKAYGDATAHMDISSNAHLLYGTLVWNYLFGREFYNKNALSWESDAGFEDSRLIIKALHFSEKISYVRKAVLYWRKRNKDFAAPARQEDQAEAVISKVNRLEKEHTLLKELRLSQDEIVFAGFKNLEYELKNVLLQISTAPKQQKEKVAYAISAYLQDLPKESFDMLRCIDRMKYYYASKCEFNSLVKLREYELSEYKVLEVSKNDNGSYIGDFPFELDDEFFIMDKELPGTGLSTNIGSITLDKENTLKVTGQIFPYRVAVPDKDKISLSAKLKGIDFDFQLPVNIKLKETKTPTRTLIAPNSGNKLVLEQPWRTYVLNISSKDLESLEPGEYRLYANYAIDDLIFDEVRLGKPRASVDIQPISYYSTNKKKKIDVTLGLSNEIIISVT